LGFWAYEKEGEGAWKAEWPGLTEDLYSIEFINPNLKEGSYHMGRLLVTTQHGEQMDVKAVMMSDCFYYRTYDQASKKWKTPKGVFWCDVKEIVFGSTQLMVNPTNGRRYPPDFKLDPYDGTPLVDENMFRKREKEKR
jgi:hypothetical protein